MRPQIRDAVVQFLREWLPPDAKRVYREMIENDPESWHRDPHFQGGIIVRHALRGNGLDESLLGVADLEQAWPELLLRAVVEPGEG